MTVRRLEIVLASLIFLASGARPLLASNTYIVGTGPGADFAEISTAIAVAAPGDVLLVRSGTYAAFNLEKGLTILGYGSVSIPGVVEVRNIPSTQRATLVRLTLGRFGVRDDAGPVILQQLDIPQLLTVSNCADVRMLEVNVHQPPLPSPRSAIEIQNARVEIVQSTLSASSPSNTSGHGTQNGGTGLVCSPGARVHLALTGVTGGTGRQSDQDFQRSGDGGPGIEVRSGSQIILAGDGGTTIRGGSGWYNLFYFPFGDCCLDGQGAPAIEHLGGSIWYSGVVLWSSFYFQSPSRCDCITQDYPPIQGVGVTAITPDYPTLASIGEATAGSPLTLRTRGPPGAHVFLKLGRQPAVVPDSALVERLLVPVQSVNLGAIPASGEIDFPINVLGVLPQARFKGWPLGTLVVAQAEVWRIETGELRRTNSVPIVVR